MKNIVIILLSALFANPVNAESMLSESTREFVSTFEKPNPVSKKIDEAKVAQIKIAIQNRRYAIVATQSLQFSRENLGDYAVSGTRNGRVYLDRLAFAPTGGLPGTKKMRPPPPFYISVSPDAVMINLPYCGIEEKDLGNYFDYKEKRNKKGNYTIRFKVNRSSETFQVNLTIKPNGECNLVLTGEKKRGTYTYYGYIKTNE